SNQVPIRHRILFPPVFKNAYAAAEAIAKAEPVLQEPSAEDNRGRLIMGRRPRIQALDRIRSLAGGLPLGLLCQADRSLPSSETVSLRPQHLPGGRSSTSAARCSFS